VQQQPVYYFGMVLQKLPVLTQYGFGISNLSTINNWFFFLLRLFFILLPQRSQCIPVNIIVFPPDKV